MKIVDVVSEVFEWERPGIWNGGHFYGPGRLHKVTVHTDEGISGYGWNGGTAAERPLNLFPGYVDYFRPLLVGRDPFDTRGIAADLGEKLIKILGPGGINTQVLAAINIACWDIKGKALGKSGPRDAGRGPEPHSHLHSRRLLRREQGLGGAPRGGALQRPGDARPPPSRSRSATPTWASRAIWSASRRPAGPSATTPLSWWTPTAPWTWRLRWNSPGSWRSTASTGSKSRCRYTTTRSTAELSEASNIKIATGENGYHLAHFRTLLDHKGASILNVDVTICPGYDVAKDVTDLAAERGVSIAPHGCQELQLPLAAAVAHGEFLEYYPRRGRPPPRRDVPAHPQARHGRLRHRTRQTGHRVRAQHGATGPLQGRVKANRLGERPPARVWPAPRRGGRPASLGPPPA